MPGTLWYRGTERVSSRDSLDCTLFNHFFLSASVHTVCSFEAEKQGIANLSVVAFCLRNLLRE